MHFSQLLHSFNLSVSPAVEQIKMILFNFHNIKENKMVVIHELHNPPTFWHLPPYFSHNRLGILELNNTFNKKKLRRKGKQLFRFRTYACMKHERIESRRWGLKSCKQQMVFSLLIMHLKKPKENKEAYITFKQTVFNINSEEVTSPRGE